MVKITEINVGSKPLCWEFFYCSYHIISVCLVHRVGSDNTSWEKFCKGTLGGLDSCVKYKMGHYDTGTR